MFPVPATGTGCPTVLPTVTVPLVAGKFVTATEGVPLMLTLGVFTMVALTAGVPLMLTLGVPVIVALTEGVLLTVTGTVPLTFTVGVLPTVTGTVPLTLTVGVFWMVVETGLQLAFCTVTVRDCAQTEMEESKSAALIPAPIAKLERSMRQSARQQGVVSGLYDGLSD